MSQLTAGRLVSAIGRVVGPWIPKHWALRQRLRLWRSHLPSNQPDTPVSLVMEAMGKAYPDACFLQIGANDGALYDPMRRQIHRRRWRGIMVEPVPEIFARLQRNYRHLAPRIILENVAVSAHSGEQPFYHLAHESDPAAAGLPVWYHALGSFHKDVVLSHREHIPDIDDRLVERMVPCLTVKELCQRHGFQNVDIVQTDTEGHDYEILKLLDLEHLRPKLVLYEHHHLKAPDREAAHDLLRACGYEFFEYGYDTLAIHSAALGASQTPLHEVWTRALALKENTES